MDNKGFTLIEVLVTLVVISVASFVVIKYVGSTLSVGREDSYQLMKKSIIKSSRDYILECNNSIINCDLSWVDNKVTFNANVLKDSGYFDSLISPIDGKDLGECLIINVSIDDGIINTYLIDNCY